MWKTPSVLIIAVLALLTLGIVMLASSSGTRAVTLYGDSHYFLKRQGIWMVLAVVSCAICSRMDYHIWRRLAPFAYLASVVALGLVMVPGIGVAVGGSRRWLRFGAIGLQPSELAKFSLILMLAWWMARDRARADTFWRGFFLPAALTGLVLILILIEPDFGTTMLAGTVALAMMFVGGARIMYVLGLGGCGLAAFAVLVMHNPVRRARILAFLDPQKYAQDHSFQLLAAMDAFVYGGLRGVGFSDGLSKHFYLPEAHTDFIFPIIGEELGMVATLGVLTLFMVFFLCGFAISWRAPDQFGRMLAFGLTIMISIQALINMGVVTGCLPTKGLPLPFISFGGTSLLVAMASVGVLINIALHDERAADEDTRTIKDRLHEF